MAGTMDVMKIFPVIDLGDGLRDSPKFRSSLDEKMLNLENLETKVEKLLKASHAMVEAGKHHLNLQHSFLTALTEVNVHFRGDKFVYSAFGTFSTQLLEMAKYQTTLIDQISRAVCHNLDAFLKKDIRGCKDAKTLLEKSGIDYENALHKNSAVPKGKNAEAEEASNALNLAKQCHRSAALKMIYALSMFQEKKRFEILDSILSVLNAYRTYFHQGSDFLKDNDSPLKNLSNRLEEMRSALPMDYDKTSGMSKLIATTPDYVTGGFAPEGIVMQGYLFRRGSSKAFKSWKRRWFELLEKGQLVYRKRFDDLPAIVEEDLRICLVRPMAEENRRFCFELISPNKTHILQADSEEIFQAWVSALQVAIQSAIHNSTQTRTSDPSAPPIPPTPLQLLQISTEKAKVVRSILSVDGNRECCDCGTPNPEWASINLGITLCIECSGIHRSLGVHYSKVKSLKLDTWEGGLLKVMGDLGNSVVNRIYLAKVEVVNTLGIIPATPNCSREIRETWIRAKYVDKAFVASPGLNGTNSAGKKLIRKWSVRKPFRRERKTGSGQRPAQNPEQESALQSQLPSAPVPPSASNEDSETESFKSLSSNSRDEGENSSVRSRSDSEVLVFGAEALPLSPPTEILDTQGEDSTDEPEAKETEESVDILDGNMLLYKAARVGNLAVMCEAIAMGGNKNWVNHNDLDSTPLHQAAFSGSVSSCEFLLLNGAQVNAQDAKGRTPLYIAAEYGHTGQICLFLRSRADHHLTDVEGRKPLDVAVATENADIVTLLRLATMAEEMGTGETSQSDDTFQEIVRDIAKRAHTTPNPTSTLEAKS